MYVRMYVCMYACMYALCMCVCRYVQSYSSFPDTVHKIGTLESWKRWLHNSTRSQLRRICHRRSCGTRSSGLALLLVLSGMRRKASLTRCTFSFEWPGGPGRFPMRRYQSRLNFSYHCLIFFLTGGSFFQTLS